MSYRARTRLFKRIFFLLRLLAKLLGAAERLFIANVIRELDELMVSVIRQEVHEREE